MQNIKLILAAVLVGFLAYLVPTQAGIVNNSGTTPADSLPFEFVAYDSGGYHTLALAANDSVFVRTWYPSGASAYQDSFVYTATQVTGVTDGGGSTYNWADAVANVDGISPVQGVYKWEIVAKDNSLGLETTSKGEFQLYTARDFNAALDFVDQSVDAVNDSTETAIADANKGDFKADVTLLALQTEVVNLNGWNPAATGVLLAPNTISANTFVDSLKSLAYEGGGIWIDAAAANTNTVAGFDGTRFNPVSTLAAASTLGASVGVKRYYFINGSDFTAGIDDLSGTHEGWEFIGIGGGNAIGFGIQDIDNSLFMGMTVEGIQGGAGNITLTDCIINKWDSARGHVTGSWLADSIIMKSGSDLFLTHCASGVGGNGTPGINLVSGVCNISLRHYSGGIEIKNADVNDKISIETDGQVVVASTCTSAPITLRGNMTITDNGTTTNFTQGAALNRTAIASVNADTTWKSLFAARTGVGGSWADSADTWGATSASGSDTANIIDAFMRLAAIDTLTGTLWSVIYADMINSLDASVASRSSHSAADNWAVATRELTHLDEDITTIDLNATLVGSDTANIIDAFLRLAAADTTTLTIWSEIYRRMVLYVDEAVSGIDDNAWDDVTRTLTTADWTTDADLTPLALQAEVANLDGWDPTPATGGIKIDTAQLRAAHFSWLKTDTVTAGTYAASQVWANDPVNWADMDSIAYLIDSVHNSLDSLFDFSGFRPGLWAFQVQAATVDSVFIGRAPDAKTRLNAIGLFIYEHPSGAAGDPPDTSETENY